ncbi:TadE/TadG family type IV pilus assembly protein [Tropicimonas marinistellae]|uniref:TadE/TadG family type IV pilus assembly protein n=1 Tax=Tropicimonas marinistellae TaxID=1739787 RepID=UPI000833C0DB|nr:TadE/TadG family type IV pilus assembly protein [Tropicimonas marinistellae]
MLSTLPRPIETLRRFLVRDDGAMSVETAIILPALCYIYVGSFVWFDAFRMQNLNLNATYTISDMLSRESNGVDRDYFDGLDEVYDYLTKGNHPTQLRVSVIECTANCNADDSRQLAVCWSEATTGRVELTDADVQGKNSIVPIFDNADQLIMTETFMIYNPAFNVGLGSQKLENVVFTRPRPGQLKWDNGDDTFQDCNNNN